MNSDIAISVDIRKLLDILKENRAEHIQTHIEAVKGYKKAARKALKDKLIQLKDLDKDSLEDFNLGFYNLTAPHSYEDQYTEVIDMLEFSLENGTATDINLDQSQYREYIKDEWSWKGQWAASNAFYGAGLKK